MVGKGFFLICEQGCRDLGLSPTKVSSVYDLKIANPSDRQKKKKKCIPSRLKVTRVAVRHIAP